MLETGELILKKSKTLIFPCFYGVVGTRVEVCERLEIPWEHEHEVRVKNNKNNKKINLLILIAFIQRFILFVNFPPNPRNPRENPGVCIVL